MKILTVSDEECPFLWDYYVPGKLDEYDLIISCGDLNSKYLSFLVTMAKCPVLYVHGNHDDKYEKVSPDGFICIEYRIYVYKGVRILGLGGSMRYRPGQHQYTEWQMKKRVWKLKFQLFWQGGFDILVTHAPAYGINDGEDLSEEFITYKFIPQAFLSAYMRAYSTTDDVYLIIEEINRGNCAQIFGDLFQLLDRDEKGVSEYTIKADADLKDFLVEKLGADSGAIKDGELCLPSNLYIYATMNTSDQSLFPIDSAFKRRWDWEYEPIKYKNTDWIINIQNNSYSWESFQREINKRVYAANNSEDKMLGDYFVNPADGIITEKMLLNKILFYLWNDVCKDGEGDIFRTSATDEISFSELHGNGGTDKLIAMMAYLGIPELDYREENADTDAGTDTKKKLPKYSINDSQELYSTPKAVQYIIGDFAQSHQDMPVDEMISLWNDISERKNCLVESWTPSPNDNQTFATKRRTEIKWGDKSAWVINGWTEELFNTFIKNVREKIGIEVKKAE